MVLTYRFDNVSQELHTMHVIRNWPNANTPVLFQREAETAGGLTRKNIMLYVIQLV